MQFSINGHTLLSAVRVFLVFTEKYLYISNETGPLSGRKVSTHSVTGSILPPGLLNEMVRSPLYQKP